MRNQKTSKAKLQRRDKVDLDVAAVEADFEGVDLDKLERVDFKLDPKIVERIRSQALVQVTLRVGEEQIEEARREAKVSGTKYQAILRRWLAEGASAARIRRHG